jgi:hypothetical protein
MTGQSLVNFHTINDSLTIKVAKYRTSGIGGAIKATVLGIKQ